MWLRLAKDQSRDGDGRDADEQWQQWVCVEDRGKALLEPVRDADMGSATVPQEEPLADRFDRPFEPRLQAPDFEKPEVTGHENWHHLGGEQVWLCLVFDCFGGFVDTYHLSWQLVWGAAG